MMGRPGDIPIVYRYRIGGRSARFRRSAPEVDTHHHARLSKKRTQWWTVGMTVSPMVRKAVAIWEDRLFHCRILRAESGPGSAASRSAPASSPASWQSPSTRRTTSRRSGRFGVRSKVGSKVTGEHCRARRAPGLEGTTGGPAAIGKNPARRPPSDGRGSCFLASQRGTRGSYERPRSRLAFPA
jgi:hypothetical protein